MPLPMLTRPPLLQRGFTLIEVMITVAIIGILAAVALPGYSDYVRRGRLPEAFSGLSGYRILLEQYYQDHRNYGAGSDCGVSVPAATQTFTFSCVLGATDQSYVATATSTATISGVHTYTVDQSNARATTMFKGTAVSGKACWLVKGSEC
jgi:type IV pilus assembly protein PilE